MAMAEASIMQGTITSNTTEEPAIRRWSAVNECMLNLEFEDGTEPDEEGKHPATFFSPQANSVEVPAHEAYGNLDEEQTPLEEGESSFLDQWCAEALAGLSQSKQANSPPTPASSAGEIFDEYSSPKTSKNVPLPVDLAGSHLTCSDENLPGEPSEIVSNTLSGSIAEVAAPDAHNGAVREGSRQAREEGSQGATTTPENAAIVDTEADRAVSSGSAEDKDLDDANNTPEEDELIKSPQNLGHVQPGAEGSESHEASLGEGCSEASNVNSSLETPVHAQVTEKPSPDSRGISGCYVKWELDPETIRDEELRLAVQEQLRQQPYILDSDSDSDYRPGKKRRSPKRSRCGTKSGGSEDEPPAKRQSMRSSKQRVKDLEEENRKLFDALKTSQKQLEGYRKKLSGI